VRRYTTSTYLYTAGPSRFGRYPVLTPDMAMTSYPDPLPVPDSIPRPPYVPRNFFTAPWGEHDEVSYTDGRVEGAEDMEKRTERLEVVAGMAAEILQKAGKMLQVSNKAWRR
jgi:methionyl aminopeptidase